MKRLIIFALLTACASAQIINPGGSATVTATTVTIKTASYTVASSDFGALCTPFSIQATATVQFTLPSTAPASGCISVKNDSLKNINGLVKPGGSTLIDRLPIPIFLAPGVGVTFTTDGTNYYTSNSTAEARSFAYRHQWQFGPSDSAFNMVSTIENTSGSTNDATGNELAPNNTKPALWQFKTTAVANHSSYFVITQGSLNVGNSTHPTFMDGTLGICLPSSSPTTLRYWAGFIGGNGGAGIGISGTSGQPTTDVLSPGVGGYGMRLSTVAGDATWQIIAASASHTTIVPTGITLDTNCHLYRFVIDDFNGHEYLVGDGTLIQDNVTDLIPTLAQPYFGVSVAATTTTATEIDATFGTLFASIP